MIGITNSTLVTILGLAEIFFNSSFNFFLSNNVLSMDENTSTILPPVLFKIVRRVKFYRMEKSARK